MMKGIDKLYFGDRGKGKTYNLILESCKTNTPILAMNRLQAKFFYDYYQNYVANQDVGSFPTPLTLDDLRGTNIEKVLVDELDMFVNFLLRKVSGRDIQISSATITPQSGTLLERRQSGNYYTVNFKEGECNVNCFHRAYIHLNKIERLKIEEMELQAQLKDIQNQIDNLRNNEF